MSENSKTIHIRVNEEAEIFNPLDPEEKTLSDEVIAYIDEKIEGRKMYEKVTIEFICDKPLNMEKIEDAFRYYAEDLEEQFNQEYKVCTMQQIYVTVIGVLCISLWLGIRNFYEHVLIEMLSIIGSFAIWEAATIFIEEKPAIQLKRKRLKFMKNTTLLQCDKEC